ncbi:MAG: 4,5-dihydroxyphthalate decarboxylase [Pseudomonadota bacterium]
MEMTRTAGTARLVLTLAMTDYDHVRDFTSGEVRAEGIDINHLKLSVEEIFFRFVTFREWDVSELSMAKYVSLVSQNDASLAAIPVFPSRVFRHSSIYVRSDGALREPRDLVGRKVGVPEWAQTAGIYARGALMHRYGVRLQDIDWVQAGVNEPGRVEKVELRLPKGTRLARVADQTLNDMLLAGEIDAIMTARPPAAFASGHPGIVRLFRDCRAIEEEYWRETGIFPIMHTLAIRAELLARFPWIAMNLYKAFEEAKRRSLARALDVAAARFPIPWVQAHAEGARALMGDDFWPYGIEPNRTTLQAFLDFALEQGLAHRKVEVEELFPATVRSAFKV